jgi:SulP family sulfate permease
MLVPKLVTALKTYNRKQFVADLSAGLIVGIVALPLAIAFAIASGVTPDRGLYTAIIAWLIISALGGSRVQISGPTGAFVVIVYGIVQKYGVDGLMVATIMAGLFLIGLGSGPGRGRHQVQQIVALTGNHPGRAANWRIYASLNRARTN